MRRTSTQIHLAACAGQLAAAGRNLAACAGQLAAAGRNLAAAAESLQARREERRDESVDPIATLSAVAHAQPGVAPQ